jgi:uncharacterized protein YcbK (DUF882 family)
MKDSCRQRQSGRMSRRDVLRIGTGVVAGLILPPVLAAVPVPAERSLSFYNTHTGESTTTVYRSGDGYIASGLQEINVILRDHRSGDIHAMDKDLLDLLFVLRMQVDSSCAYQVISGYRSPATNAALHKNSSGVAKHSFHMQGKAIDIRLPGCDLQHLHRAALDLKAGGVGYYTASNFIHVDVGPVRRW